MLACFAIPPCGSWCCARDRFAPAPASQRLKKLLELPYVDDNNYERVCLYLLRMADYMSDPDDLLVCMIHARESVSGREDGEQERTANFLDISERQRESKVDLLHALTFSIVIERQGGQYCGALKGPLWMRGRQRII